MAHGTRYSVLLKLDQKPANYTIRAASSAANQVMSGFAVLSYLGGTAINTTNPSINYVGVNTTSSVRYLDSTTVEPFPPLAPAATADATFVLTVGRLDAAWMWAMDNSSPFGSPLEEIQPLLVAPGTAQNTTTIWTKNGTWVDLIVLTAPGNPPHPMHKHNNKGYLLVSVVVAVVLPWAKSFEESEI
jgi:hypothetical protein